MAKPKLWKNLTIRIPEPLHKELKMLVVQNNDTIKDILVERINQYIDERKKTVIYQAKWVSR